MRTVSCWTAVRATTQPAHSPPDLCCSLSISRRGWDWTDVWAPCPQSSATPDGAGLASSLEVPRQPWSSQLWAAEDLGAPMATSRSDLGGRALWSGYKGVNHSATLISGLCLESEGPEDWGTELHGFTPKAGQHRVPGSVSSVPPLLPSQKLVRVDTALSLRASSLSRARCACGAGWPAAVCQGKSPSRPVCTAPRLRGSTERLSVRRPTELEAYSWVFYRTRLLALGLRSLSVAFLPFSHRLLVAGEARGHSCV